MSVFIRTVAITSVLLVPVFAFAQSSAADQPLTRAEVRAQLVQFERAGYNPAISSDAYYPADMQAAETRVRHATHGDTGYGGAANLGQSGVPLRGGAASVDYIPVE